MNKKTEKTKRVLQLLFLTLFFLLAKNTTASAQSSIEFFVDQALEAEKQMDANAAIKSYAKAIEFCSETDDKEQLPELLFHQARMYSYLGNYDLAINNLTSAHDLLKERKSEDLELEARIFVQFGNVFFFMKRWDEALYYYQKAHVLARKLDNKEGLSIIKNNIGNIYQKKKDFSKAIEFYETALIIQEELQDSATICNTTHNIASCYYEEKKLEKANEYSLKAYEIASAISDVEISTLSLIFSAKYHLEKDKPLEASKKIDLAEKIATECNFLQLLLEVYKTKALIQETLGNHQAALVSLKRINTISDSIFSEKSMSKLRDFQVKYETLEKENMIQLQEAKIKKRNIQFWTVLIGLFLSFIIVFLLILFYRLQKLRNKELVKINATRDKFYAIISHDLKNPAIAQRNTLQSLIENIENLDKEILLRYCSDLLHASKQQLQLLHNLLNWSLLQTNSIPFTPIRFSINSLLSEIKEFSELLLKEKELLLTCDCPAEAIAFGDKRLTGIILRNLLTNAIKFSHPGGEIKITVRPGKNKMWEISVSDYGVGIKKEKLSSIFSLTTEQSSKGTSGEIGSGFGLVIAKEAVEKNGGKITVKSEVEKGSTFTFTIQQEDM